MGEANYWTGRLGKAVGRRRLLGAGGLATAAAASAFVLGCGDDDEQQQETAPGPAAAEPKRGGTVQVFENGDPVHRDVHQNSSILLFNTIGLSYSQLIRHKLLGSGRSTLVGDLAENWEQVDDVTFTFRMRPNVKFQNLAPVNGRSVTAEDVVYSFDRQRSLKTNATFLEDIKEIRATTPTTLRVVLNELNVDFLKSLAAYTNKVIAREVVEKHGELKEAPVVGSGAWIFEEWIPKSILRFRRNPDYYRKDERGNALPYADALHIRQLDEALRLAAFRTGQLHVYTSPSKREIEGLKREIDGMEIFEDYTSTLFPPVIMARVDRPPTNDLRVRQALLAKGLNRQVMMDTTREGSAIFTAGVTPPEPDWRLSQEEVKKVIGFDQGAAKTLLTQAGFTGWNPKLKYRILADGGEGETYATLIRDQLAPLNVRVTLEGCDIACLVETYSSANFELLAAPTFAATITTPDLNIRFRTGGARNSSRLSDPALDDLIRRQAREKDQTRRKDLFNQIERKVLEHAAMLPLYGAISLVGVRPELKGYLAPPSTYEKAPVFETMWLDR